jgi:hypothetical protein
MALNNKLATLGSFDCRGTFKDVIKNKVSKEKGFGFFLPLELSNSLCQNPKKVKHTKFLKHCFLCHKHNWISNDINLKNYTLET